VIAVGHSMGAQVIVALAAHHSDVVDSLVALDPAYGADAAELARIPAEQDLMRTEGSAWAVRFAENRPYREHPAARPRTPPRRMADMDPRVLIAARMRCTSPPAHSLQTGRRGETQDLAQPVLTVMTGTARVAWARRTLHHPAPGSSSSKVAATTYTKNAPMPRRADQIWIAEP